MAVAPPLLVAAQTITPARYGLASAADLVVEQNPRFRNGIEFEENQTGPAKLSRADCGDLQDRYFDSGFQLTETPPIVVYEGFTCSAVGRTEEEILDRARRALAGGEWSAVEKTVWGTADRKLMDQNDTQVLTTTAVPLVKGVGLLEEVLASQYGGVGVIHAPRLVAPFAADKGQIESESGRKVTTLGTRWSFGNYPNTAVGGAAADVDTAWLVATSAVQARRSEVTYRKVTDVRGGVHFGIAERTYVVSWESVTAAALVTLT
ncbi:hypothetical protein [Prescottella agglutinans]|uniref:Uncharacterized protein n=1 Tax=Prescottella agglutinans TaxID=1644129 RepID=A0ABT6M5D2_9NOCA|nr:hypothetical protein [Prescottella agglutinans]MDH6279528.1 hypothetical protein [Prescottella agglutinans]